MTDIAILARAAGVSQSDLLALAPQNDPFALHQKARRRNAEWFAEIFERFSFERGIHIRRVHYRVISQDNPILRPDNGKAYENTTCCWALMVNASRDARYLGLVPGDVFIDRRNPEPITFFASEHPGGAHVRDRGLSLAQLDGEFPDLPDIAFDGGQPGPEVLVEIWCEKSTMNDVLEPLGRHYGANLITGLGEMSETSVRLLIDRARAADRPAHVIYISDFDPGGRSMPVAVARKVEYALTQINHPHEITLDPLALTEAQCRDYRLPRTPIKETERRAAKFEERFGAGATELDALEALHPGALGKMVTAEIERFIDPDHKRAYDQAVSEHRVRLTRIAENVHDAHAADIDDLRSEYADLVAQLSDWHSRAETVFERISDDLYDTEIPLFEPPSSRPPDPPAEPLFASSRPYLDQIAAYREWQGKGMA